MTGSDWLMIPAPKPAASVQLVCLPSAGGGIATFAGWLPRLPDSIELALGHLPGHDARRREPHFTSVAAAADGLAAAIRLAAPRPRVLFGHSMGALIAFETSRRLAATPWAPALLGVSGRRGPSRPETRTPIAHLPMRVFIAEAQRRYGGIPDVVLDDADLRDFLLPVLRDDLASVEAYRYEAGRPLACPIVAYGGVDDPHADVEDLAAWGRETTGPFRLRQFAGGHFFIQGARDHVIATLLTDISTALLR